MKLTTAVIVASVITGLSLSWTGKQISDATRCVGALQSLPPDLVMRMAFYLNRASLDPAKLDDIEKDKNTLAALGQISGCPTFPIKSLTSKRWQ